MSPSRQTAPIDENFKEYEDLQYGLQDIIDRIDACVRLESEEIRQNVRVSVDQIQQQFTI